MRIFLAITPPQDTQRALNKKISQLQKQFHQVSWESEQKLHLTLAFFEHIEQGELRMVFDTLNQLTQKYDPFPLTVDYLSYFYKKHGNSIVYFDVQDETQTLREFYRELTHELYGKIQDLPERLSLHITVGRVKRMRYPHELKRLLIDIKKAEVSAEISFDVSEINLYESTYSQHADTSTYNLIRSFKFQKSRGFDG